VDQETGEYLWTDNRETGTLTAQEVCELSGCYVTMVVVVVVVVVMMMMMMIRYQ
jgi:heme/copper-type cytochrome/quinol oxidase subunit 2